MEYSEIVTYSTKYYTCTYIHVFAYKNVHAITKPRYSCMNMFHKCIDLQTDVSFHTEIIYAVCIYVPLLTT